ncbi:hypothetical protein AZO1586R_69 [Bathymodiolus azoricus thioautotrophic gill symbiont]|uniref:Uncharacterized protein n=1 Tax=Bathymodiolus azoricus thioautotrophic gill symbiont TaxID=235205 RepID=A0ACA8ZMQ5_9GAMM|nr:hypothetical protein AZO1586R_69 [Bathymodiolus azoricus thioautotrophic gill symbiont]
MVDLSRVIVSFIVINQCFVWFLRVDYLIYVHLKYKDSYSESCYFIKRETKAE